MFDLSGYVGWRWENNNKEARKGLSWSEMNNIRLGHTKVTAVFYIGYYSFVSCQKNHPKTKLKDMLWTQIGM